MGCPAYLKRIKLSFQIVISRRSTFAANMLVISNSFYLRDRAEWRTFTTWLAFMAFIAHTCRIFTWRCFLSEYKFVLERSPLYGVLFFNSYNFRSSRHLWGKKTPLHSVHEIGLLHSPGSPECADLTWNTLCAYLETTLQKAAAMLFPMHIMY